MFSIFKKEKAKPIVPEELLRSFIKNKLGGNINALATYDLSTLEGDATYGCPNRTFFCEDTNIARAILYIAWGKDLGLSFETIGNSYIGVCINAFSYVFGKKENGTFPDLVKFQLKSFENIYQYQRACNTLGNLILLPAGFFNEPFHGFFDLFLMRVQKVLTGRENDPYIVEHRAFFSPFQDFYNRFYLMDFVDNFSDKQIRELFKPWRYFAKYPTVDELICEKYSCFADDYIEKATEIIEQRTTWIMGSILANIEEKEDTTKLEIPESLLKNK